MPTPSTRQPAVSSRPSISNQQEAVNPQAHRSTAYSQSQDLQDQGSSAQPQGFGLQHQPSSGTQSALASRQSASDSALLRSQAAAASPPSHAMLPPPPIAQRTPSFTSRPPPPQNQGGGSADSLTLIPSTVMPTLSANAKRPKMWPPRDLMTVSIECKYSLVGI